MRRRREGNTGPPGAPFWMSSYGDLVTQILIFFVLLYSISALDVQRFAAALSSIQQALGLPPGIIEEPPPRFDPGPGEQEVNLDELLLERDLAQLLAVYRLLEQELGHRHQVDLVLQDRGIVIRFSDHVFFDSGRADLRPDACRALDDLSRVLLSIPNDVRVEGHTDSRPISTLIYPSNWELSTARATAVVRYLVENRGMDPFRLSAAGYGEYRPVADNTTAAGMARNRRVDVVVLRLGLSAAEPRPTTE